MKASFFKRMGAFILDYFIVIFIVSLIKKECLELEEGLSPAG